ncbi:PQQ-dependent sugar dehydrogenase [Roseateles toxinivorans]|uniref:Glucose/arabinose dehydrogenase n=1 Tax=Roseateles toxinivorans TaxID=270368 RepID=A0A4R6QMF5_9BURK|nr:PQQ-dependent sugar dehydrogenase [Roseateles toxinivorans]TDP71125.1 glucose/arabinose dehydrogenase [Roseateles toxinivorans]
MNCPAPAIARQGRSSVAAACRGLALIVAGLAMAACGGGDSQAASPAPAPQLSSLNSSLASPWALALLPDGRMLVTLKAGRLALLGADGKTQATLSSGLPVVDASGQGGLLDIALDPDFASTPWVYLSYAEPGSGAQAGRSGTAVARGRWTGAGLSELTVIFRQSPKVSGGGHYGSRLVFGRDKSLFVTLGERQQGSPAQDLASHLGKVVRIQRDGSVPTDNPQLGAAAAPGLWSYGHRNPQGAALHPMTGELWVSEHGPQGGDEINIARAGANHGWPLRSYGCDYGSPVGEACRIGGGVHAPAYVEPLSFWVPTSIAPSNLAFYTGSMFPEWQGQLFMGALAGQALWRLQLSGNTVVGREAMFGSMGERFRDVRQAPDGALLLLTDSGKLLRLAR